MKTQNEQLKDLTLAEAANKFGWSVQPVGGMVTLARMVRDDLPERQELENNMRYWKERQIRNRENWKFAAMIRLRDVLAGLDHVFVKYGCHRLSVRNRWRGEMTRLATVGFTQLDSLAMPTQSVSCEMLRELSREDLLSRDALVLGTLSPAWLSEQTCMFVSEKDGERKRSYQVTRKIWYQYDRAERESYPRLLVGDILKIERELIDAKGAARTLDLLESLGFGPQDGPFMKKEDDPRAMLAQSLMKEHGLGRREALKFAKIAAIRNWI